MTTTQLVGVITLVGTLLVAGIQLGKAEQMLTEHQTRLDRLEQINHFVHGDDSTGFGRGR